jgi:hypothetical protein
MLPLCLFRLVSSLILLSTTSSFFPQRADLALAFFSMFFLHTVVCSSHGQHLRNRRKSCRFDQGEARRLHPSPYSIPHLYTLIRDSFRCALLECQRRRCFGWTGPVDWRESRRCVECWSSRSAWSGSPGRVGLDSNGPFLTFPRASSFPLRSCS